MSKITDALNFFLTEHTLLSELCNNLKTISVTSTLDSFRHLKIPNNYQNICEIKSKESYSNIIIIIIIISFGQSGQNIETQRKYSKQVLMLSFNL